MHPSNSPHAGQYRVWIVEYADWQPRDPRGVPPQARALEPAEEGTMSARQARLYTQSFNRTILAARRQVWAVAVPVIVRYEGDLLPGQGLGQSPHRSR
jgi:hypothetical protein